MPTITLQVGQCGNQIGQQLWSLLDAQRHSGQQQGSSLLPGCDVEFFKPKSSSTGSGAARCLLVDTEPKVVSSILRNDTGGLLSARRSYIGQSGRGNNWAYGYSQLHNSSQQSEGGCVQNVPQWDACTTVQGPGERQEACSLDNIMEGVHREAEACDSAPNFLLLHALAGGSGSGLGSRLLESLREEFPLNCIASVSVAPRVEGDSPMQQLNAIMSLSFLQAYADVVLLHSNSDLLQQLGKSGRSISLHDMNMHIAQSVLGALWPLDASEVAGAYGRIQDMVCTVASDPCMKLVQPATIPLSTALGAKGLWQEACKTLRASHPRYDALDEDKEVVLSSAMLIARGMSPAQAACTGIVAGWPPTASNAAPDSQPYIQAGGAAGFATPADASSCVFTRSSPQRLVIPSNSISSNAAYSSNTSPHQASGSRTAHQAQAGMRGTARLTSVPAATAIVNSSAVVGLLSHTVRAASNMCSTGAYLHWYERSGCSKAAVLEAMEVVHSIADAYRLATGIRDFL